MRCSGRESIIPLNKVTIPFISNSLPNHLLLKVVYFKTIREWWIIKVLVTIFRIILPTTIPHLVFFSLLTSVYLFPSLPTRAKLIKRLLDGTMRCLHCLPLRAGAVANGGIAVRVASTITVGGKTCPTPGATTHGAQYTTITVPVIVRQTATILTGLTRAAPRALDVAIVVLHVLTEQ